MTLKRKTEKAIKQKLAFEKITEIDKPLYSLTKKRKKKTYFTNDRNERGVISTD